MAENHSYGRKAREEIESTQMKIHSNNKLNNMIKNGRFRVMNNRYSYLNSQSIPIPSTKTKPQQLPTVATASTKKLASIPTMYEHQNRNELYRKLSKQLPKARSVGSFPKAPPKTASVGIVSKFQPNLEVFGTALEISSTIPPESEPFSTPSEMLLESEPSGTALDTQLSSAASNFLMNISESVNFGITQEPSKDGNCENPPPYINYMVFNRLGLSIKNLTNLLNSSEDFELNIIDCNSQDNSWDYIQSLTDSRIKSKTRFTNNLGPIYASNFALSRRKPNQYFITIDSDTFIKTENWIARFMEVFDAFPEVGLLGVMRDNPYPRYLPQVIPRVNGNASYLELKNADIEVQMDFVPGQLQCLSPKLIKEIGYWSEENGFGDAEISPRVVHYTNFKVGFLTTIEIDMTQRISCNECTGKNFCTLSRSVHDCFSLSKKYNKNESFVEKNTWKFKETFQQLEEGKRTAYCASIHDPESIRNHIYNSEWAFDNFYHYLIHSN